MKGKNLKKTQLRGKKPAGISYRIKCKKTANGLSHYVPAEKKALV